jgi:hypothetical protein
MFTLYRRYYGLIKTGFTQTSLIHSGSELSGNITVQVRENIRPR